MGVSSGVTWAGECCFEKYVAGCRSDINDFIYILYILLH